MKFNRDIFKKTSLKIISDIDKQISNKIHLKVYNTVWAKTWHCLFLVKDEFEYEFEFSEHVVFKIKQQN